MENQYFYEDLAIFIIGTTASGKTKLSIDLA
jgi:tRNA A37 N6-isopentenylltransferase MiaA